MRNIFQIAICIAVFGICLFRYLDRNNEITERKLRLPELDEQILLVEERAQALQYEVDRLESPLRLMELLRLPEYAHLRHPTEDEVCVY